MVTLQKDVYYRQGIWHLDLTHKTDGRWWSLTLKNWFLFSYKFGVSRPLSCKMYPPKGYIYSINIQKGGINYLNKNIIPVYGKDKMTWELGKSSEGGGVWQGWTDISWALRNLMLLKKYVTNIASCCTWLYLMAAIDLWWTSSISFGVVTFHTVKIDNFRRWPENENEPKNDDCMKHEDNPKNEEDPNCLVYATP